MKGNFRKLLFPTLFAATGMAVLVGLGIWQLQRKAWKEELIARLQARAQQAALPLVFEAIRDKPAGEWEFQLAELRGRFLNAIEFHVWTPQRQGSAWTVFTPFEIDDGSVTRYPRLIMVARGIVSDMVKQPSRRREGQIEGVVTIAGRLRQGETPGLFAPSPNLAKNEWHARDIAAMRKFLADNMVAGSASGRPEHAMANILPAYLEYQSDPPPGGWPRPALSPLNLKNDHLGYALTWFGIALTLASVYGVFAVRLVRSSSA
jgi:surfeit locus 1 family protein